MPVYPEQAFPLGPLRQVCKDGGFARSSMPAAWLHGRRSQTLVIFVILSSVFDAGSSARSLRSRPAGGLANSSIIFSRLRIDILCFNSSTLAAQFSACCAGGSTCPHRLHMSRPRRWDSPRRPWRIHGLLHRLHLPEYSMYQALQ